MLRRDFFTLPSAALAFALPGVAHPATSTDTNVLSFGAIGDGKTLNTRALQAAIDAAWRAGGGLVYVPAGTFLTGGLALRSRTTLFLDAGATLLGSTSLDDYRVSKDDGKTGPHLISAYKAENVTLCGYGTIDGQGHVFWTAPHEADVPKEDLWRKNISSGRMPISGCPSPMIDIASCTNVRIEGLTLQNSPGWTLRPIDCDSVIIHALRIRNPAIGPNTDGIDITASRNVLVSDCDIITGDDAIVIKSLNPYGPLRACANITVTNCQLSTNCSAFKIGTETNGAFENITFSNSVIYNGDVPLNERAIAGITLSMVDGGTVDGVMISNIRMKNVRTPICVRLGTRKDSVPGAQPTHLRNVVMSGIDAVGAILTSSITGVLGHPVQDIVLDNIRLSSVEQGIEAWTTNVVPEKEKSYPEARIFGRFPAYGLYVRHAEGIRLRGVALTAEKGDERPALVCDDVDDLIVSDLEATAPSTKQPLLVMQDVRRAFLHGCRAPMNTDCFLEVKGAKSKKIVMQGNELSGAVKPFREASDVASDAVTKG